MSKSRTNANGRRAMSNECPRVMEPRRGGPVGWLGFIGHTLRFTHQVIWVVLVVLAGGCGSSETGSARCEIGRSVPCACIGGGTSAQVCTSSATWSTCVCVTNDAGIDVSTDSLQFDATQNDGQLDALAETSIDTSESGVSDGGLDSSPLDVPADVQVGLNGVTDIFAGRVNSCARLTDGTFRCWGYNREGQFGDGSMTSRYASTPVPTLVGVARLVLGRYHSCALMTDTTIRCWGSNDRGQLGDGTMTNRLEMTPVPGLTGVAEIALGPSCTCVRMASGTISCWGFNRDGQFGDGTNTSRLTPTPIPGIAGVTQLVLGDESTCARLEDSTVRCWGTNQGGQLGDGTVTAHLSPLRVSGLTGVAEIAIGDRHACARMSDSTVRCWGQNDRGQLGDGTMTDRLLPTPVLGLREVTQITVGSLHTCARTSDGAVRCWGINASGQLGDGTRDPRLIPNAVVGLDSSGVSAIQIAGGNAHTCARMSDATVRCWGANQFGQLGDGSPVDFRLSPNRVQ
jgi:alpha-tubulin suppressor-like RCC1 family protein